MASGISNFAKMIPLIFQFTSIYNFTIIHQFKTVIINLFTNIIINFLVVPLTKLGKKYGKNNTLTGNYFMKFLGDI